MPSDEIVEKACAAYWEQYREAWRPLGLLSREQDVPFADLPPNTKHLTAKAMEAALAAAEAETKPVGFFASTDENYTSPSEDGFYWIRLDEDDPPCVAQWQLGLWWPAGEGDQWDYSDILGYWPTRLAEPTASPPIRDEAEKATRKEDLQVEAIRQAILDNCWGDSNGNVNGSHDAAKAIASLYASPRPEAVGEAVKAERERCAWIADNFDYNSVECDHYNLMPLGYKICEGIAAAIMAGEENKG